MVASARTTRPSAAVLPAPPANAGAASVNGRHLDTTSLVAGLALIALGGVMLLDRVGALDLRFAYLWPALLATLGAILLASGLGDGDAE